MKTKIKIKAAVLEKNFRPLTFKDVFYQDDIKKGQILVKLLYSGICGSQIGEINAIKGKDKFLPHLLGHEATAKVIRVNKYNSKFNIGEKVILHWQKSNGKYSKLPKYFDAKGNKINAGWVTTFNNYAVVSETRATKLPKNISNKIGILFGCGLTTAYGALAKNLNLKKINSKKINSKNILLTGYGMIGQIMVELISAIKIPNIFVVEKNKKKLLLLKNKYKKIKYFSDLNKIKNIKFDVAFETTGNKKMIEYSFNNIKNDGKLILIGVPHYKEKIAINTLSINYGKKIIGCYGGDIKPNIDIPKIANFVKTKNIKLNKLLCGPFKFTKINNVLSQMQSGKLIKKPIIKF